ncbi:hypothetical protein ACWEN6_31910 [Sphaerisporangium sp. NPDC004334]
MRRRMFLFSIPVVTSAMAAALMSWSLPVGIALLLLTMLVAMGLAFWALHHVNAEHDRREQTQGTAPRPAGSAWAAAGRWLAKHWGTAGCAYDCDRAR